MNLHKFTILHVEDDPDDALLIHDAFVKLNYACGLALAKDGVEALDYLAGRGAYADREKYPLPSLILLDLKLPRKSGLEVLAWLRGQPEIKCIPIAILTSSENSRDIKRAYELGVNSYLIKPVDFEALQALVRDLGKYWIKLNIGPEVQGLRLDQPISRES